MLRLHEYNETKFDGGCLAVLHEAAEIFIEKRINDITSLYLDYPCISEKADMIKENMIISHEGEGYVILKNIKVLDGRNILQITASDFFSAYGRMIHIQNIPDMIGVKPSKVLERALEGSPFTMFTKAELQERGMTWVDADGSRIDFFTVDKTNVWEVAKTIVNNCGKGEIYRENFKVAIVERIGTNNGVRLTLEKNMQDLQIQKDSEHLITRLYPYGADDMHIGSINGGKQYIDSPNIEKYGIREGYRDYSDYTSPEKIKAHAQWEFDERNENRIDIPKLIISGNLIDLSKLQEYGDLEKIDLGDTVHVYDIDGTVYHQRVVAITYYPYEPKQTTVEIGHERRNMPFFISQFCNTWHSLDAKQTTNKQIASRKLEGTINTDRNMVVDQDKVFTIDGSLLEILDPDTKLTRVELGCVERKGKKIFVFTIYGKDGQEAIYMDENGDAVFSGAVNTVKDSYVGQYLFVGQGLDDGCIYISATNDPTAASIRNTADGETIISGNKGGDIVFGDAGVCIGSDTVNNVIVTKKDIIGMKNDIETLKEQIANLIK
jgi:hypothetical protein